VASLNERQAPGPPRKAREDGDRWQPRDLIWIVVIAAIVMVGRFTPFKPVQNFFGAFGWMTEQALSITKDLFESYGYLTVFLAPLLENTLFIGAIIPGTLVMLLAGLSAEEGLIGLWPGIPLAILGAWIGDTISYGIGRFGWQRLGAESRLAKWSERMRAPLFNENEWVVVAYHFAGYSRLIGPAAAGFMRMPFRRWVVLDYAGAALWVIVFMMLGYILGMLGLSLDTSERNVRIFELILFAFFVIAVLTLMRQANQRQANKSPRDVPPDDAQA
jgi:membrane protein DedA with SNARE-associated domain